MRSPQPFVIAAVISLSLWCFSCAGALKPLPGNPYTQRSEIDVGDYVVTGPPGDGWFVNIQQQQGAVGFARRHLDPDGSARDVTTIAVMRNVVSKGAEGAPEETIANDFRHGEEENMRVLGTATGVYDLSDVRKGVEMMGDKKLYSMHYKTTLREHPLVNESALYLFFPRSFEDNHVFYMFLVSHAYRQGSLQAGDLSPGISVIESFRLK